MALTDIAAVIVSAAAGIYSSLQCTLGEATANVVLLAIGISLFAIAIGKFYKNFSRRELFAIEWEKVHTGTFPKAMEYVKFAVEYILLFPLIVFVWFVLLGLFLFFVSGTLTIEQAMFISIALVAATRIVAYYDEEVSADITKMIPLALLAVFLASPEAFSIEMIEQRLVEMAGMLGKALPYIWLIIPLEVVLRVLFLFKHVVFKETARTNPASSPKQKK